MDEEVERTPLPEGFKLKPKQPHRTPLPEGFKLKSRSEEKPEKKQERGAVESALRLPAQYALGAIEGSVPGLVYDIGVAPANSKAFGTFNERVRIGD